jgi:hypothetical protein
MKASRATHQAEPHIRHGACLEHNAYLEICYIVSWFALRQPTSSKLHAKDVVEMKTSDRSNMHQCTDGNYVNDCMLHPCLLTSTQGPNNTLQDANLGYAHQHIVVLHAVLCMQPYASHSSSSCWLWF